MVIIEKKRMMIIDRLKIIVYKNCCYVKFDMYRIEMSWVTHDAFLKNSNKPITM